MLHNRQMLQQSNIWNTKDIGYKKKKGQVTPVPSQIWEESRCLFSSYGVISDKVTN